MLAWLIVASVVVLTLIVVVTLTLLLRERDSTEVDSQIRRNVVVAGFRRKPLATVRTEPPVTFRRKRIQRRGAAQVFFKEEPPPLLEPRNNGGNMKKKLVKVDFDAICRVTGRSKRVCRCTKCEKERSGLAVW